jgi:cell division protein FtsB
MKRRRQTAAISTSDLTPRKRRRRIVESVLVAIGCIVLVDSLIGERGLLKAARARKEARFEQGLLRKAQAETIRLREQKRLLESDGPTIEDAARRELGLIKPGEKLFIIRDVPPPSGH